MNTAQHQSPEAGLCAARIAGHGDEGLKAQVAVHAGTAELFVIALEKGFDAVMAPVDTAYAEFDFHIICAGKQIGDFRSHTLFKIIGILTLQSDNIMGSIHPRSL